MCAEIVLVGQTIAGSRTPQRARAFQALGHRVGMVPINIPGATYEDRPSLMDRIRYRLRCPADPAGANEGLLREAERGCDVVWIEAAPMITAATLRRLRVRHPLARLVWYSEDDMMNPVHRSRQLDNALGLFDLWVTTKSFNTRPSEMPSLGVLHPLFVDNSFDPDLHRPMDMSEDERWRFGADIAFVGTFEAPRARSLLALAQAGLGVRVWGNGWRGLAGTHPNLAVEDRPVYDEDYARVVSASRINLGFLRKGNRDLQTCRTVEIPACGGFMLHERSPEAERLLAEGREAAFFSHEADLITQCCHWLNDEAARLAAAAAGRRRVLADGHDHPTRLQTILGHLAGQEPKP